MQIAVRIRTALLSLLAVAIIATTLLLLGSPSFNAPYQNELVQLDDGWTITHGEKTWSVQNIQFSDTGVINNGDIIALERTLPASDLSPAAITFKTVLSSVEVSIAGENIYTFGEQYVASGRMLPKMEHFIQLPPDYSNKKIRIEITAREDDAFSGLSPIFFGNYNDLKNFLLQNRRLPMVIGVYLCHLGFMLLILAPFLAFAENHDFSIFLSAVTSIMIGVYILCYNDIFWYISDSPSFYTFVEYFCLFMIPPSILGFIITSENSRIKLIGIVLLVLNLLFVLCTSVLHLLKIIHICHFVVFLHVLGTIEGIFVIISLTLNSIRRAKSGKQLFFGNSSTGTLILGLIIFTGCSLVDIIKFNIMKFSSFGEINAQINFMTVGALIFIMSLLLNYFYHCIEYINDVTVTTHLEGLAYQDALTELSNRAKCEQFMAELDGEYTIISLDLDYLKYTNDNYGHAQGDKLIHGFADILKNSFTDASLIGRMGGDEFLVILPFVDEERTKRDIDCFTDLMKHKNDTEPGLRFAASWGYAGSNDPELNGNITANRVYLLADQRMYILKNFHHKQSLGRLYDDLINKMLDSGGKQP